MARDRVIIEYTLEQAIKDGVLVEIFKNAWGKLSGGKPILATSHLFSKVSLAGLREIWNEYALWKKNVKDSLPEEERMFATSINGEKVWVIEDAQAYTLLYPDDY